MKYIDLHLHSYYSDGIYSPRNLIKKARREGFGFISLTDHNGVAGTDEAIKAGKDYSLKVISGVEINTKFKGYIIHLLGYGFDWKNKELSLVLEKIQAGRRKNIERMILALEKQGFKKIERKKIFDTPSKDIGLNRIIDSLRGGESWQKIKRDFKLKRGQILTLPEIFKKYFYFIKTEGGIICPGSEIPLAKAVCLIKKAGGIPVIAHPAEQLSWRDDHIFPKLKKMGVMGIEAISSHHNWDNIEHYQKIAKELKLLITIGSDFHGDLPGEWQFPIKSIWQYFKVSLDKEIQKSIKKLL